MQGTYIGLSRVNHFFTQKLYSISVYVNNIYSLAILSQKNIRKKTRSNKSSNPPLLLSIHIKIRL